jgi:hypothetical protein
MILATLVQACNALALLRLLGIKKAIYVIILSGIFFLYPGFLDYYSFASNHIDFVAGDSLALLGFMLIFRLRDLPGRCLCAALCWFLALSVYAPKVALIGLFMLMLPLMRLYVEPALQGAKQTLTPEICWPESRSRSGRAGRICWWALGPWVWHPDPGCSPCFRCCSF